MARVLVVAPAWVGDMTMAHTLVPARTASGAEVHFLAPAATVALATRMPDVAVVHGIRTRHGRLDLGERWAVAMRLRRLGFDQAIVLPGSFKAALTPFLADIPRRTGFRGECRFGLLNDMRPLDAEGLPRLVDRFAALADVSPGCPRLRSDAGSRQRLLEKHGLRTDRPVIALCPGAEYGSAKRWPTVSFAELARDCAEAGARVWMFGGPGDVHRAAEIAANSPAVPLAGKTSLADAVDLLSAASAVVANDSGLLHVAAALRRPVVAVYGSSSPAFTPPLAERAAIVERELACRPCFQRECPLGHRNCLQGIPSQRVFAALRELGAFDATPPAEFARG